jgi:apolipoprotein N-acyltransferase
MHWQLQSGSITSTGYNEPAVIRYNIPTEATTTLYVKWGDWLYKITGLIALLVILYQLYGWLALRLRK